MNGRKSENKGMVIVLMLVIVSVLLGGCLTGPVSTERQIQPMRNRPNFDIVDYNPRTGYEGLNYVVYVDMTIYNKGDAGHGTVWCRVSQDNSFWTKSQTIYVDENGRSELTFVFREFSFWGGSGEIRVWVTY